MKELLKKITEINAKHWDIIFANPKGYSKLYEAYISEMQELMIEYAKAKCQEQRHLCCKNWRENKDEKPKLQPMSIFNAPAPDFE